MRKIVLLVMLLFIGVPTELLSQRSVTFPEGAFRDTGPEDFEARNLSSKRFNELWTYQLNLDNGVQVIYSLSINDFGAFKGRVTGAKLIVSWSDGRTYVVNKEYDVNDLVTDPDEYYLRLNPNRPFWVRGNLADEHELNFEVEKDGVSYDLNVTLYDIAQGKNYGNGIYQIGNHMIGLSLLIPHARVKGTLAINGQTQEANGTAYMDHIYQNNFSTKLIDKSYRVKSGDAQNGFYFHFITLENGQKQVPIGYGVHYQNGAESLLTPSALVSKQTETVRGTELDRLLLVKPFQMDTLRVRVTDHRNTYSILDELSGVQKFFARRFVGGELVEMNGQLRVNDDMPGYFYYMAADD